MITKFIHLPTLGNVYWPTNARDIYEATQTLLIPNFLSFQQVEILINDLADLPVYRVCVPTAPHITWDNQEIPAESIAFQAFASKAIFSEIRKTLGLSQFNKASTITWSHSYKLGEYIPKHRDIAGTTQLLICLQLPSNVNQPVFYIMRDTHRHQIPLGVGDALLFNAVELLHGTNPIIDSNGFTNSCRVVLVTRYYFSGFVFS
jgi:hypothetical protein